ncbi:MAG: TonB-dependent receptor [Bryobacter sp.]|nr:TonB-dependent receptor [Bryobacter sp.]
MKRLRFHVFAAILFLLAAPSFAQNFGEITGTVTDSSGAAIAGAEITLTNLATNQVRTLSTTSAGTYTVPFVTPGQYKIEVKASGFKTGVANNRQVQVGDVARADFSLEVGQVSESVEVAASAEMLQTSSTATGTVIEQKRIVELPLNGRNYLQLVRLAPNVTAEMAAGGQANGRQGGERANQSLSIAGMRQQYNRFTLDGVENTDVNFNTFVVRPSVDALQEFKVQTGVYSAEFGRSPSQINVNTKPGTNDYHGVLFHFLRNDAIQARQWLLSGPKSPFRRNQFGFTLDGPLSIPKLFDAKNKLFFMVNYEGLRERKNGIRRATVADQAMLNGDFSHPAHDPIFDPNTIRTVNGRGTADPFPNQRIPTSRFSPTFTKLLQFYEAPNIPGAVAGVSGFNYERQSPNPVDWDQLTSRIDWNESATSQWFGRYSWGSEFVGDGQTFPQQDQRTVTKNWQAMVGNVRTFSPTLVNELRLGATIFDNDRATFYNFNRDVTSELAIPGLTAPIQAAWGSPQIGFDGNNFVSGWGEATEAPFILRNRTYQLLDNLSWIKGKHTFKMGGEIANRRFNQVGNQFPRGFFQFPSRYTANPSDLANTGSAFATGLLGWTQESTRALGLANTQFRQWSSAFYFEDTWKILPNLTLNLGIRYEYTPPFADRYRGIFNVQLFCNGVNDQGIDPNCPVPVLVRPGPGDFHEGFSVRMADRIPKATGDDILCGRAAVCPDKNDWAPRIGIAWQPTSRMTVRTGYGLFYAQDTGNPVWDMARNLGFRESARSVDLIPTSNLSNPWARSASNTGTGCAGFDGLCLSGLYTLANHVDRRTAYVHQYLMNVQYQLTDTMLIEVGYQGNGGRKLMRMYGWNDPIYRSGPDDRRSSNERRPWGNSFYNRIQTIGGHVNSSYNSGIVKLQQRFSSGLTYLASYTWARSIDSGSAIRTNDGDNLFPANNYDFTSERGLSQFHQLHRFAGSLLYEMPFGKGKRFDLGKAGNFIAGGWSLGSIITMATGSPFGGGTCGDLAGITQGSRGDATGVSPFLDNPTPQEFFRRSPTGRGSAAITCSVLDSRGVNELTYREGNIARNTYLGPGLFGWDLSLLKRFDLTEKMNLEFRFESFNFPNHPNWNQPNTNLTSPQFGQITSARDMRTNQFALKLAF